jgi:hypothetical protein
MTHPTAMLWRRLVPTIVIVVCLVCVFLIASADIRDRVFSPLEGTLNWTTERNNAGAVQAITAIVQAVSTMFLLWLTWRAIDTSRQSADRAQTQAAEEAQRARNHELQVLADTQRQAKTSTLPVIAFIEPKAEKSIYQDVSFRLVNVGMGPALFTVIELSDAAIPFQLDRAGEKITLRVGEEATLTLTADKYEELRRVLDPGEPNEHGHYPLVTLTARCHDVRGNTWESKANLVWDGEVRFATASFSHPD